MPIQPGRTALSRPLAATVAVAFIALPLLAGPGPAHADTPLSDATLVVDAADPDANPFHLDRASGPDYPIPADQYAWDPATRTLTLDHFSFETSAATAVSLTGGDLTLVLRGANLIRSAADGVTASAALTTGLGRLVVQGEGSLSLVAGHAVESSAALHAYGAVTLESGALDLAAGRAPEGTSAGLVVFYGDLRVGDGAGAGPVVTATGGAISHVSVGVLTYGPTVVAGGSLTAAGGAASSTSLGLDARGGLTFAAGTLLARGHTRALDLRGGQPELPDVYRHRSSADADEPGEWTESAVAAFANTTDLRNIGLDTTELSEPGGGAGVEGGPDATASVTPAGPTESSGPGGEGGSTVTPGTGSTVTPGTGSTVTPGAGAGATAGPGGGSTAAVRPEAEATGPAEAGATAGPAATTRPSVTASPRPLAAAGTAASRVVFFVAAALTVCGAVLMGVAGQHDRRQ